MGRLEGKVAFITGAARGQGRAHAVRMAEEGASIVAADICGQIATVFYPMSTTDDLAETERLVKEAGASIVTVVADVRSRDDVNQAYAAGIAQFGHIDTVVANAGVMPVLSPGSDDEQSWHECLAVMLTGVRYTVDAAIPGMIERGEGGSVIITSSSAGLTSISLNTSPGALGYSAAKHGVVGLIRVYAKQLAPHSIRVNTIHPTAVNTPMVANEGYAQFLLENPDVMNDPSYKNAMPVEMVEAVDIANAAVFLASDEARYVTGVPFPVDAGYLIR